MNSRMSFFSKSFFKSDIKRYWWVSASELLLFIICTIVPLYNACFTAYERNYETIYGWIDSAMIVGIIFSFGVGIMLNTFMHFNASVSTTHSLPVKRSTLYITKLITAFVILCVPMLIAFSILTAMSFTEVCSEYILFSDILRWLFVTFSYSLVVLSLTTLVNMMTGNPVGTVVFTIGFGFLPMWIIVILSAVFSHEVLGYSPANMESLMEYVYIGPYGITKAEYGFIYPVLSVIFLALGYLLYRIRKSESHGEVIAFSWLKPLFMGIIALLASGLGYSYVQSVFEIENLLSVLPFGILGTAISYMISRKALDFKGSVKPIVIYICLALAFAGVIRFDITGFERRIPDADDVKSAYITSENNYDREPIFFEKEHIDGVRELHRELIATTSQKKNTPYYNTMIIEYTLKNGKKLTREYRIVNSDNYKKYLKPLWETEEFRKSSFPLLSQENKNLTHIDIYDRRIKGDIVFRNGSEEFDILLDALYKDMRNFSYEDFAKDNYNSVNINIYWEPEKVEQGKGYQTSQAFYLTPNTTNTEKALAELSAYGSLPTASDIERIHILTESAISGETLVKRETSDPEEIAEIYALYDNMLSGETYKEYDSSVNVYLNYTLKNDYGFDVSCTYDEDILPDIFK